MNSPTTQNYIDAAKIISTCRADRLDAVIDLLRKGGIELSESMIHQAYNSQTSIKQTENINLRAKRKNRYESRWKETNDPIIVTLRNAYLDGYKIADIASAASITRTALYEYMRGDRQYSPDIEQRFIFAFNALGIQFPSEQPLN